MTTDMEIEIELVKIIRDMKVAISAHNTEEYEIQSVRLRSKLEAYFINGEKPTNSF